MNKRILVPVSLVLLLAGCGDTEHKQNEETSVKVKVEKVGFSDSNCEYFYSGTVKEENTTALSFPVMGTVDKVYATFGETVRQGELLATIDESSMVSAYEAAKASLLQAEDAYNRMKELHEKGSLAEIKWIDIQSKYRQAKSMEELAKKNLDDCKLYSPYSGVISSKSIEVGQNVAPGVPVFNIVSRRNMNVRISVPENEISRIEKGQKAVIVVPALEDMKLSGVVAEKGIQANPISRSYEVKIKIDESASAGNVMPGMVTEVYISKESDVQSVVIPAAILQLDEDNNYFVWLNKSGKATKRIVICSGFTSSGVTVESGLNPGDEIIVEGQQKVSEGTLVSM